MSAMALLLASAPFEYVPAVEQPRSFGHFVGDVLTQRIPLDQGGRHFQPSSLPAADRVGLWFQRLPPRLETDAAGRHWLIVDYQIINSPRLPVSVALPALTIPTDLNAPVTVGSWPIHLSPLSAPPAYANVEPLPLRPDHPPARVPTRPAERRLAAWSACLAVVLSAWLGWLLWANRRDALRRPFARVLRELRGLPSGQDDARAWICVHRALNETAGRAIQQHAVERLFSAAPHLEPLRAELEEFYRRSSARFYARSTGDTSFPLADLCLKLRRIEKQTSPARAVRS
jgi:mxaA protein